VTFKGKNPVPMVWLTQGDALAFARAVIAADRAKRVPMTHAQRVDVLAEFGAGDMWDFFDGIRAAEAFHGIGSKT